VSGSGPAAARLVPADKAHVSMTAVMSGISIAAVLAVPAGTYIGAHLDWRVAFVVATVIPALVLVMQCLFLPKIVMDDHVTARDLVAVVKARRGAMRPASPRWRSPWLKSGHFARLKSP
jgi:predicted MFS family arabinose efflux permease